MVQGSAAAWRGNLWETLEALVDADGSATHPHLRTLRVPTTPRRDLADAMHALLAVHGAHPGMVDEARARSADGLAASWLDEAADAMGRERQLLARLAAAAGPLPSTPGQAASDAALMTQRHAFQMLARSDRRGVALGAAVALTLDWVAIRRVLARAADGFAADISPAALPVPQETATVVGLVADGEAAERAVLFGARALIEQHRALWSLLAARASAREG